MKIFSYIVIDKANMKKFEHYPKIDSFLWDIRGKSPEDIQNRYIILVNEKTVDLSKFTRATDSKNSLLRDFGNFLSNQ